MQAQTFQYLIDWTAQFHAHLADCLEDGLQQQQDPRAKWLMEYLVDHERTMAREVKGFKDQADEKALKTWLYEHLTETLPPDAKERNLPFGTMGFDDISKEIFDVHNQVIEVWRSMSGKGAIPEARELSQNIFELEEHETLRLADQISSSREM